MHDDAHTPSRIVALEGAFGLSAIGDWAALLLFAVAVVERGGGVPGLLTLLLLHSAPTTVVGVTGGAPLEGTSHRRSMLASASVRAVAVASLALGRPSIAHVYVVALLTAACAAAFGPHARASARETASPALARRVARTLRSLVNWSLVLGPLVGGVAAGLAGPYAGPLLVAGIFAVAFAATVRADVTAAVIEHPEESFGPPTGMVARARWNLEQAWTVSREGGGGVLAALGLAMGAIGARATLEPLLVLKDLRGGAISLGVVVAAWGAGAVVVASARAVLGTPRRPDRALAMTLPVAAIAVAAGSMARSVGLVVVAWAIAGTASAAATVAGASMLAEANAGSSGRRAADATRTVLPLAFLSGVVLGGFLGSALDVRVGLSASGGAALLAGGLSIQAGRLGWWRRAADGAWFDFETLSPVQTQTPDSVRFVLPVPYVAISDAGPERWADQTAEGAPTTKPPVHVASRIQSVLEEMLGGVGTGTGRPVRPAGPIPSEPEPAPSVQSRSPVSARTPTG